MYYRKAEWKDSGQLDGGQDESNRDLCTTPLKSIGLISLKSCAVCFDYFLKKYR